MQGSENRSENHLQRCRQKNNNKSAAQAAEDKRRSNMLAIGCDHGGYELKQEILKYLDEKGIEYKDFGCDSTEAVDYPIYARKVASAILDGTCDQRRFDLRDWNRYFHYSQQDSRDPRGSLHRLLLRRGDETAQRCEYPCAWRKES